MQNENDTPCFRVTATIDKCYDILEYIHSLENGYVGNKKALIKVKHHCGF